METPITPDGPDVLDGGALVEGLASRVHGSFVASSGLGGFEVVKK